MRTGCAWMLAGALLLASCTAGHAAAQATTSPDDPDNRQLARLQLQIAAAMAPFDSLALDSIFASDFQSINAGDQRLDKAEVLRQLRAAQGVLLSAVDDSIRVRRYGTFAIMTAREVVRMRDGDRIATGSLRMTAIWIKRDGRWQVVGGHVSVIP